MSYKPYCKDTNGNLVELPLSVENAKNSKVSEKLGTTTIGSTKEPIYLLNGVPKKCSELNSKIVDLIYPVGSIYLSVSATSPETLFGGKWEQLKDRFLLGAGNSYGAGATGGETSHTLTIAEMPSHTHTQNSHNHTQDAHSHLISNQGCHGMHGNGNQRYSDGNTQSNGSAMNTQSAQPAIGGTVATNQNTGGGGAHNNMPPYLAVYMWKRTA